MTLALLLLACGSPTPTVVAPSPDTPTAPVVEPSVDLDPAGTVTVPDALPDSRDVRRMDIDQLDASIRIATGGIGWDVDGESQFQELSGSLGVPDYTTTTSEDLAPGLLFQKFLDDAANTVCQELVDREFSGSSDVLLGSLDSGDTRATNPSGVDAALSRAVLRFHGRAFAPDTPQLDEWTYLFDSTVTVTGGDTMAAWRSVCIGLIVHPDFYQY